MGHSASVAKHPIHPMLVPLPIGLWLFSLLCDLVVLGTGSEIWNRCALYTMVGGTVGALVAALPGLWDLYHMHPGKAKKLGIWHMSINLGIVAIYVINALWRRDTPLETGQLLLSLVAVLLLMISGWLGGEMVYVHGVAVAPLEEAPSHHGAGEGKKAA